MTTHVSVRSEHAITIFDPVTFEAKLIASDHPHFEEIVQHVIDGTGTYADLAALADPIPALAASFQGITDTFGDLPVGRVAVNRLGVTYDGEPLHGYLAETLVQFYNEGADFLPWVRFLESVKANPFEESAEELFLWLTKANMPVLPDGRFLAYKRVNNDYTSIHDGVTMNAVGTFVSMPGGRAAVDADRRRLCSTGLHFCSKSYLPQFGSNKRGDDRILLLAIWPKDVVSIPADHDDAKGRAVGYEIIGEIALDDALAREWGPSWTPPSDDDYDDVIGYDDDDDDEETDDAATRAFVYALNIAADLILLHGWRSSTSPQSSGHTIESAIAAAAGRIGSSARQQSMVLTAALDDFRADYGSHLDWDTLNDVTMLGDRRKVVRALHRYANGD